MKILMNSIDYRPIYDLSLSQLNEMYTQFDIILLILFLILLKILSIDQNKGKLSQRLYFLNNLIQYIKKFALNIYLNNISCTLLGVADSWNHIMTPADLQRMFQTRFLTEISFLPNLFDIKDFFQKLLIKQIAINMQLKRKLGSFCISEDNEEPPDTPQSSQSNFSSDFDKRSQQSRKTKQKRKIRKNKNDTKNIPKNFGKAIITFIEQKQEVIKRILQGSGTSYENFLSIMKSKKRNLHSIAQLRGLWLDQSFQYAKQMRKISIYFLKRVSLSYIFGSRICNYEGHIKYRQRFIDVLKSPKQFTYIKS